MHLGPKISCVEFAILLGLWHGYAQTILFGILAKKIQISVCNSFDPCTSGSHQHSTLVHTGVRSKELLAHLWCKFYTECTLEYGKLCRDFAYKDQKRKSSKFEPWKSAIELYI